MNMLLSERAEQCRKAEALKGTGTWARTTPTLPVQDLEFGERLPEGEPHSAQFSAWSFAKATAARCTSPMLHMDLCDRMRTCTWLRGASTLCEQSEPSRTSVKVLLVRLLPCMVQSACHRSRRAGSAGLMRRRATIEERVINALLCFGSFS